MAYDFTLNVTEDTLPGLGDMVETAPDAYAAASGAHAIAVLTEWDEFKALDLKRLYDSMVKPAFLFDGRTVVDLEAARAVGFETYSIGRPATVDLPGQG